MKVTAVRIHNFRGIVDQELTLYDYTLLVGPNNAGKSTVVDALRCFYEKDKFSFKPERDRPYIGADDNESWIEIDYRLNDEERDSLKEEYRQPDNVLSVRKWLRHEDKEKNGKIFGYTANGELSDAQFYGASNVQQGKLGEIVYIPAVSRVDDVTKLSGPSALRDLLTSILEDVVKASVSFDKLQMEFESFAGDIKTEETGDGRSIERFETEFSDRLSGWGISFEVTLRSPTVSEIIKSLLDHRCLDKTHGKAQSPDQFGTGFQRHFIYSLIEIGPQFVGKKPGKKSKDFSPEMTLILFEEPEAFLHPPQQETLARNLRRLSDGGCRQVVCTTHSSHFVSKNSQHITSIVRVKRTNGVVGLHQIGPEEWAEIVDANQQLHALKDHWKKVKESLAPDDLLDEMEAVKYCLWLNPDRAGLFFANHVLLVEGTSETALISRLIGDGRIHPPEGGLYVLDCMGKFNIHRFMNLLGHLGTPHTVLFDDDRGKDHHAALHGLIESSKNDYTFRVKTLPGDLEAVLQVERTKPARRKPQHILFQLENGGIDIACLDIFCRMVQECLGADVEDPVVAD